MKAHILLYHSTTGSRVIKKKKDECKEDLLPRRHDLLLAAPILLLNCPEPVEPNLFRGLGFGVQGSGFRVHGSGFRVQVSGFRVQGSGFRV